jgi:uncharacterized surface protein with fasciclin (FAS1) repeats
MIKRSTNKIFIALLAQSITLLALSIEQADIEEFCAKEPFGTVIDPHCIISTNASDEVTIGGQKKEVVPYKLDGFHILTLKSPTQSASVMRDVSVDGEFESGVFESDFKTLVIQGSNKPSMVGQFIDQSESNTNSSGAGAFWLNPSNHQVRLVGLVHQADAMSAGLINLTHTQTANQINHFILSYALGNPPAKSIVAAKSLTAEARPVILLPEPTPQEPENRAAAKTVQFIDESQAEKSVGSHLRSSTSCHDFKTLLGQSSFGGFLNSPATGSTHLVKKGFTVFVPTDSAMKLLSDHALRVISNEIDIKNAFIASHITNESIVPEHITTSDPVKYKMLGGEDIELSVTATHGSSGLLKIKSNDITQKFAHVSDPGIKGSDGVSFAIDVPVISDFILRALKFNGVKEVFKQ